MNFGYLSTFQALDKGLIECFGPTGFVASTFEVSSNFSSYNNGFLYNTIFIFVIGLVSFLTFFAFAYLGLISSFSLSFFALLLSFFAFSLLNSH
jgi:hypothetical protein